MNYKIGNVVVSLGKFVRGILDASRGSLTVNDLPSVTAMVEQMEPFNLVDLDLSQNSIHVGSTADVQVFERFIAYVVSCPCLRLLDLSGNPLGPVAFASLARLHSEAARSPPMRTDVRPAGFLGVPWLRTCAPTPASPVPSSTHGQY